MTRSAGKGFRASTAGAIHGARRYLERLADHGVTTLRLMLEYAEFPDFLLEDPIGRFRPEMVQLWDDLFALLEELGLSPADPVRYLLDLDQIRRASLERRARGRSIIPRVPCSAPRP